MPLSPLLSNTPHATGNFHERQPLSPLREGFFNRIRKTSFSKPPELKTEIEALVASSKRVYKCKTPEGKDLARLLFTCGKEEATSGKENSVPALKKSCLKNELEKQFAAEFTFRKKDAKEGDGYDSWDDDWSDDEVGADDKVDSDDEACAKEMPNQPQKSTLEQEDIDLTWKALEEHFSLEEDDEAKTEVPFQRKRLDAAAEKELTMQMLIADRKQEAAAIQENFDHLAVGEIFEDARGVMIDLPWAEGGNLEDFLKKEKLSEEGRMDIALQVTKSLVQFHQLGYLHGDVKLPNFLVFKEDEKLKVKISDYDMSEKAPFFKNSKQALIGSDCYRAPEIFEESQNITQAFDIFGLGVVLAHLLKNADPEKLTGVGIFNNDLENYKERLSTSIETGLASKDPVSNLIRSCLEFDTEKRPSASQVYEQLQQLKPRV